jgi:hypothetical protein
MKLYQKYPDNTQNKPTRFTLFLMVKDDGSLFEIRFDKDRETPTSHKYLGKVNTTWPGVTGYFLLKYIPNHIKNKVFELNKKDLHII